MTLFPCVPVPEKGLRPQLEPQQEPGLKGVLAVSLNGILLQVLRPAPGLRSSHPIMV